MGDDALESAALQHGHWRNRANLSSGLERVERFLENAGFDRAPWLAVAFAAGIAAWFALDNRWQWLTLIFAALGGGIGALALMQAHGRYPWLRRAVASLAMMLALGCTVVWIKSITVGTPPAARMFGGEFEARVLSREDQPAQDRVRLILAIREAATGRAIKVRVNLPREADSPGIDAGARLRLKARLMPPAPPMLPGSYDFARTAWFSGLAATGSVLGRVTILEPADGGGATKRLQRRLSEHVRSSLPGTPGSIAAAFASGDRGAIPLADEEAMRNAGLTHLLSVSGLHVSAVVAAAYLIALWSLGLWSWLALRFRLPIVAAGAGALAGIGYTLLTGAEVPTVRSCIGAVLVLLALVLGREALSMRMVAVAVLLVLLVWPEALIGPSFQMSFAAVIAIIALHGAAPLRALTAPREEPLWSHVGRRVAMLLLTGVVIELALMPIGLFHFHRAGVYGAMANVVAIPLTTFVTMPLIALALLFDAVGAGAPFWWLTGKSLELLLWIARWTAAQPGAVSLLPAMGTARLLLFVGGGLWLALWHGRVRLWGLLPAVVGALSLFALRPPDLLVSGDGRHVGITGLEGEELLVMREGKSDFATGTLSEIAGMEGKVRLFEDWRGARCNRDFCAIELLRGGRTWHLLVSRGKDMIEERALAAACDRVDIVIADRWLPYSCKPRWFKADRAYLAQSGGLVIDLTAQQITSVAQGQGEHGWWSPPEPRRKSATPRTGALLQGHNAAVLELPAASDQPGPRHPQ